MIFLTRDVDDVTSEQSLFTWLRDSFYSDEAAQSATVRILGELLVFYILVLVGFAALWLTWRSNTRIRRLRQEVGTVLRQQRTTAFEAQDAKMFF